MLTYACTTYGETFSTKNPYISHSKKCCSKATIHLAHTNQTIEVVKDGKGNFICQCSVMGCPKPFKFANSLRAHIKKAGSRWLGPEIQGDPSMGKLDLKNKQLHEQGMEAGSSRDLTHEEESNAGGPSRTSKHLHDDISESDSRDVSTKLMAIGDKGVMCGHGTPVPSQGIPMLNRETDSQGFVSDPIPSLLVHTFCSPPTHKTHQLIPQDEIMHSPPPPAVWVTIPGQCKDGVTYSPQVSPSPKIPSSTSTSTSTSTTIAISHVNAEFHFLTCQVCEMPLGVGEVKSHLAKIHGRQATYSDMTLKPAMASLEVNDRVHPQFKKAEKENKDCKFADVVAPAAYGIYQNEELQREAEKRFGESWGEGGVYVKWLMRQPRQGHHSNLIDLIMWYHEHSQT
ncbi:hypothetical protein F5J12DRAFT_786984 [Pisolithus orientalis]|uniref:uncharacterized protein n=1 Tax=Pisolithus orientalis TaxID=936130 RepID=UPI002224E138|nr:uncharacterized protein F5J12DRAFT_786984 [Pisolithus orientalis]KAI5987913.1 hypothetical protein F5J12DRAFT_786984 [Pisolithus orientalis]